jgi:hypothetical protein
VHRELRELALEPETTDGLLRNLGIAGSLPQTFLRGVVPREYSAKTRSIVAADRCER